MKRGSLTACSHYYVKQLYVQDLQMKEGFGNLSALLIF